MAENVILDQKRPFWLTNRAKIEISPKISLCHFLIDREAFIPQKSWEKTSGIDKIAI